MYSYWKGNIEICGKLLVEDGKMFWPHLSLTLLQMNMRLLWKTAEIGVAFIVFSIAGRMVGLRFDQEQEMI